MTLFRAIRLFTTKIADSAAEGVQMVSDKAFATEVADVQQTPIAPEHQGEPEEPIVGAQEPTQHSEGVQEPTQHSEGVQEPTQHSEGVAKPEEDPDSVDLAAVLGGNIRKAPAAETADDAEPIAAETGA